MSCWLWVCGFCFWTCQIHYEIYGGFQIFVGEHRLIYKHNYRCHSIAIAVEHLLVTNFLPMNLVRYMDNGLKSTRSRRNIAIIFSNMIGRLSHTMQEKWRRVALISNMAYSIVDTTLSAVYMRCIIACDCYFSDTPLSNYSLISPAPGNAPKFRVFMLSPPLEAPLE